MIGAQLQAMDELRLKGGGAFLQKVHLADKQHLEVVLKEQERNEQLLASMTGQLLRALGEDREDSVEREDGPSQDFWAGDHSIDVELHSQHGQVLRTGGEGTRCLLAEFIRILKQIDREAD
jgi:hypothetical protein